MPRTTDRPERLYLRVTEPLRAELEQIAAEDGRTLTDLARWVLRDIPRPAPGRAGENSFVMKLPSLPLKRDPNAALAKAQLELTQAETKLSELAMERGQALVDSDDVAAVAAIDQQLADQHRTITILIDRCQALANQVWKLDHERREAERTAAIAELESGFDKRHKLALEVEAAVTVLGDAWAALLDSREDALKAWPEIFPRPPAEVLRSRQMERELSWALYAAGRPVMGVCKLPTPGNIGLGVTGVSPKGIAGVVEEEHANILVSLRMQPIPNEVEQEEEAA